MVLYELFIDAPSAWHWYHKSKTDAEAKFMVGDIEYVFYSYVVASNPAEWEIEFRVANPDRRNTRFDITGTGNAAVVMSVVVDIIRDFLNSYPDIRILTFFAKEESRKKLYGRMVRRLLPTWKVIKSRQGQDFKVVHPSIAYKD